MTSAAELYETTARDWDARGRPVPEPDPLAALVLTCWLGSKGAEHDHPSTTLHAYAAALRSSNDARHSRWFEDLLDDREHCRSCGMSWRLENCRVCTHCGGIVPPCCPSARVTRTLQNGNEVCPKCSSGELVG